jgi:hypothetical protein
MTWADLLPNAGKSMAIWSGMATTGEKIADLSAVWHSSAKVDMHEDQQCFKERPAGMGAYFGVSMELGLRS